MPPVKSAAGRSEGGDSDIVQFRLSHLDLGQSRWSPPADRDLLRLRDLDARVMPLYDPGAPTAVRRQRREKTLAFLQRHHYLHQAPEAKQPAMTWSFGLYLNGQLAGVVVCNPPAAGVAAWLYGKDSSWRSRVLAITRTVCAAAAPFNSESFMVSAVIRMLGTLDDRFSLAVAYSDLGIVDPHGKHHIGQIYMASNAWWAGHTVSTRWRGLYNPATGARISRKNGGRNRSRAECPPGWIVEESAQLSRFLWFFGRQERAAREQLLPGVRVSIREGGIPLWRRPAQVHKGAHRAYSSADKLLRAGQIS